MGEARAAGGCWLVVGASGAVPAITAMGFCVAGAEVGSGPVNGLVKLGEDKKGGRRGWWG
jgi:hypothetical protein